MASIAKTIADAINKVSSDEIYANMEFATREEARDSFTAALLYELGLGPKPSAAHATVTEPKEEKPKKKRAAKKATEAVVAEAAVAILEQVKEKVPEVEALAEQMGQLALEEQPKPKKARKSSASSESESEKPKEKKKPGPKPKATHVGVGAGVPPPEEAAPKKKPGPKPKAKPEGPVNVAKLTPTHKKHLKAMAEQLSCGIDDKAFLAYANEMSAEEWGAKSLDDHIRAFVGPLPGTELAPAPTTFLRVEFNDKEYLVDPATRYVYAATDDETVRARDRVGVVGMLEFADMELPEEDE